MLPKGTLKANRHLRRIVCVNDHIDRAKRSSMMAAVRSKNTKPELIVRKIVHALGFRYRLYGTDLPGKPDLVFRRKRKVIFVHGCFWHRHQHCSKASMPKTRIDFWREKFDSNVARDRRTEAVLAERGWNILTVWECELKDLEQLTQRLNDFLSK